MTHATPPVATRHEYVHTEHGVERSDPYFWMRQRDNPEVRAHLDAENHYTEQQTVHLGPLKEALKSD